MEPPRILPRRRKRPRLGQGGTSYDGSDTTPQPPLYRPTPPESLFPLLLHVVPPGGIAMPRTETVVGSPPNTTTSTTTTLTECDRAMARVEALDSYLTPSMISSLNSLISIISTHLSAVGSTVVHPFITSVLSNDTPDDTLRDWANIIDRGLCLFAARGGRPPARPGTPSSSVLQGASSTRSQKVHRQCAERDDCTCVISRKQIGGIVAHVLPFSLRASRATDFWEFVSLFRGVDATEELKTLALGPGQDTDAVTNVFWLAEEPHSYFDNGWLAIIPQIINSDMYDPNTTTEYTAKIEFPFGSRKAQVAVWKYVDGEPELDKLLKPGDTIYFTTRDPARLPLPHPLVFQLHAIISRVMAMKAAAGYPVFGDERDWGSDEDFLVYSGDPYDSDICQLEDDKDDWSPPDMYQVDLNPPIESGYVGTHAQRWLLPEFSQASPPLEPKYSNQKRRRADNSRTRDGEQKIAQGEISNSDGEQPRKVEVVLAEEKLRAEDRYRIYMEKWGGEVASTVYL